MKKTILFLAIFLTITIASQAQSKNSSKIVDSTAIKAALRRESDSLAVNRPMISLVQINSAIDHIGKDLGDQLTKAQWEFVIAVINKNLQDEVNKALQKK